MHEVRSRSAVRQKGFSLPVFKCICLYQQSCSCDRALKSEWLFMKRMFGQEIMLILPYLNLFSFRPCFKQNELHPSATGMIMGNTVPKSLARGLT